MDGRRHVRSNLALRLVNSSWESHDAAGDEAERRPTKTRGLPFCLNETLCAAHTSPRQWQLRQLRACSPSPPCTPWARLARDGVGGRGDSRRITNPSTPDPIQLTRNMLQSWMHRSLLQSGNYDAVLHASTETSAALTEALPTQAFQHRLRNTLELNMNVATLRTSPKSKPPRALKLTTANSILSHISRSSPAWWH